MQWRKVRRKLIFQLLVAFMSPGKNRCVSQEIRVNDITVEEWPASKHADASAAITTPVWGGIQSHPSHRAGAQHLLSAASWRSSHVNTLEKKRPMHIKASVSATAGGYARHAQYRVELMCFFSVWRLQSTYSCCFCFTKGTKKQRNRVCEKGNEGSNTLKSQCSPVRGDSLLRSEWSPRGTAQDK